MTPVQLLEKLTRGDVLQAEIRLIEAWRRADDLRARSGYPAD